MKRKIQVVLASMLALSMTLFLVACGSSSNDDTASINTSSSSSDESSNGEIYSCNIGVSNTGGTMYTWGVAACDIVKNNTTTVSPEPMVTIGSTENVNLLLNGDCKFASIGSIIAYAAYTGLEGAEWAGQPVENLRAVYAMYPDYFYISVAGNRDDINSLSDLEGMRVSFDQKGNGACTANLLVMDALGIDPESYFDVVYLSVTESYEGIQEGTIDAYMAVGTPNSTAGLELANSGKGAKNIPLNAEERAKIAEAMPLMVETTMPANLLPNNPEMPAVGSCTVMMCSADVPDQVVYDFVKALDENHEEFMLVNNTAKDSTPENSVKFWGNAPVPMHPGAVQYFTEIGLM